MDFTEIMDVIKAAKDAQEDGVVTLEEAARVLREIAEVFGVEEYLSIELKG